MMEATTAITLDEDGEEAWSLDPDRITPGASTVKVATTWLARQHLDMADLIEVLASDDIYIPPTHALRGGDIARTDDMIRSTLIVSDNYGANALARTMGARLLAGEGVSDPTPTQAMDRYCDMAMGALTDFGWTDHLIRNGSGIQSANRFTTRQIADLWRHVRLTDPWLHNAGSMMSYTFRIGGPRDRAITPVNSVSSYIDQMQGYVAGKTGTDLSGVTYLVWSWRHPSGQIMTSALGGSTRTGRPADASEIMAVSGALVEGTPFRLTNGRPARLRWVSGDLVRQRTGRS